MSQPISGMLQKGETGPFHDLYRVWYRQAKPYDLPLDFISRYYFGFDTTTYDDGSTVTVKAANFGSNSFSGFNREQQATYNRAYANFVSQLSDTAGWAENLAQIQKTRLSVVTRAAQISQFVRAVRDRRFKDASRIIQRPVPSNVSHRKNVSQNFLEWEFGIKPTLLDLQSSLKLLTDVDFGTRKLIGRASSPLDLSDSGRTYYPNGDSFIWSEKGSGKVDWCIRASARIHNPNLFLANQLGLIDIALPWKLIPFSFVVDWFVNVEQVMTSMTDFIGVTLDNPHVTFFSRGKYEYYHRGTSVTPPGISTSRREKNYMECQRSRGLPGPSLTVKPFKGFSLQRGAQAIALVLSVLGK